MQLSLSLCLVLGVSARLTKNNCSSIFGLTDCGGDVDAVPAHIALLQRGFSVGQQHIRKSLHGRAQQSPRVTSHIRTATFTYGSYDLYIPKFGRHSNLAHFQEQASGLLNWMATQQKCDAEPAMVQSVFANGSVSSRSLRICDPFFTTGSIKVLSGVDVLPVYSDEVAWEVQIVDSMGDEVARQSHFDNAFVKSFDGFDVAQDNLDNVTNSSGITAASVDLQKRECIIEMYGWCQSNFQHWFQQGLPELMQVLGDDHTMVDTCSLLFHVPPNEKAHNALMRLGFTPDRIMAVNSIEGTTLDPTIPIEILENGPWAGWSTPLYADLQRTPIWHPVLADKARRKLGLDRPLRSSLPPKLMYFSRPAHAARSVSNEAALVASLRALCLSSGAEFSVVDSALDIDDLYENNTALLVGPHGGGLYNVWSLPDNASVLEIMPAGMKTGDINGPWFMSAAIGLDYYRSYGRPVNCTDQDPFRCQQEADVEDIAALAQQALLTAIGRRAA